MSQSKFIKGQKWRVIKDGSSLSGMQPIPGGQQGWGKRLAVGDVLTCAGVSMSFGDGVPLVKWLDENGKYLANDCEFLPAVGGMWNMHPNLDFLELVQS